MYWETLPSWLWAIYNVFLLTTFGTAVFSVMKKNMKSLSLLAIIFAITAPIISLLNSIGRTEGMNEFEHLISQLKQGAFWSIFAAIGYLFLIVWWVMLLKSKTNNQVIASK